MNFARMQTIYEVLQRQGVVIALRDYPEDEIRQVARHYGMHLPDRPLQPSENAQLIAKRAAAEHRAWLRAQAEAAQRRQEQANENRQLQLAAAARRAERFSAPAEDEEARWCRAFDDAVDVLDRPCWARCDAEQRKEKIAARAAWTFAAGSDDNLAITLPRATLVEMLDGLLKPDIVFASRDVGATFRQLPPQTRLSLASGGRFNRYLAALDLRVQTFEDAEAEEAVYVDYSCDDARSRLTQLAIDDEVPHLATCWKVNA